MMITAFRRSSAIRPSGSTSGSGTSTASAAGTPSSRTTSGSIAAGPEEMFVPLSHPPGHAQCDFGEVLVVIGGVQRKAHCFVLDLPHSDGCFVKAYPAESTEALLDGHVSAFAFLGECPGASSTTIPVWRWPRYWGTAADSAPAPSLSSSPTTCSTTVSGVPARATTRERWKDWWATRGGISWCPSLPLRASKR